MQGLSIHQLKAGMSVLVDYAWDCEDGGDLWIDDGLIVTIEHGPSTSFALVRIYEKLTHWPPKYVDIRFTNDPNVDGFVLRTTEED